EAAQHARARGWRSARSCQASDQVVGGQGAAGDRDPGRPQRGPAGQLAQGELSRLGCWLGRELAVADARWQWLSRAREPVPMGLVDLPDAAAGRPGMSGEETWLAGPPTTTPPPP